MGLSKEQQRNKIRQQSDNNPSGVVGDKVKRLINGEIVYLTKAQSKKQKPAKARRRPPWVKSRR
jgi:hypothetical protein